MKTLSKDVRILLFIVNFIVSLILGQRLGINMPTLVTALLYGTMGDNEEQLPMVLNGVRSKMVLQE